MGLLTTGGKPIQWGSPEHKAAMQYVLDHGIVQFLNMYQAYKDVDNCPFYWGEELEHQLVIEEEEKGEVAGGESTANSGNPKNATTAVTRLSLNAARILEKLMDEQHKLAMKTKTSTTDQDHHHAVANHVGSSPLHELVDWRPEYGSFMVESVPHTPYNGATRAALEQVEVSMRARYTLLDEFAGLYAVAGAEGSAVDGHTAPKQTKLRRAYALTLVTFPLMGQGEFYSRQTLDGTQVHALTTEDLCPASKSLFIPDVCINNSHPRFATLTENIRLRRGRKVCIQVPLFIDKKTRGLSVDPSLNIDYNARNAEINCLAQQEEANANGDGLKMKGFHAALGKGDAKGKVTPKPATPTGTSPTTNSRPSTPPPEDPMAHLFTPATNYYYAQYLRRAKQVKERYEACPCPNPSVRHPCVYMDCMAFGMGCDCLQATMQFKNIREARYIYDQLAVMCPIFLALSSATPFQKGFLCDSDVRWLTIAASVDDRKMEEVPRIMKSRYDSISVFLSSEMPNVTDFNDLHVERNEETYARLVSAGVDAVLAHHVAHLFIRDPLVIFDQMIHVDDRATAVHFENIQSTNWQTVRFKPPPLNQQDLPEQERIGWRVEFRVMDIQPTPYENAAFSVFLVLLTRAILKYKLLLYVKMSQLDENMGRAHLRDPCAHGKKYWWRKNIRVTHCSAADSEKEIELFSIRDIIIGCPQFEGLLPIVRRYVSEDHELRSSSMIQAQLDFIGRKASGEIPTVAKYWREFITKHPDYKHDSRITEPIALDIVTRCHQLATGEYIDETLVPTNLSPVLAEKKNAKQAHHPHHHRGTVPVSSATSANPPTATSSAHHLHHPTDKKSRAEA